MESATEMLFSKANQNAELAKESSNEVPKEISESSENDKIQKESTDNITSIESGINSISLKPQEEKPKEPDNIEKNNIKITTFNSVNDFFFPIVNNKIQEESKNSEQSKESQEKTSNDFSSIDLKIPESLRAKNNISTTQNKNSNPGQDNVPNYYVYPNSLCPCDFLLFC